MQLNDKERDVLNYILNEFYFEHFDEFGHDECGNLISYNNDPFRLEQFRTIEAIIVKLKLC
uniref:hypothetical protein n=1 Tax=uncultured Allobacillus sp. TaxID=1638025 RepID=UPI00259970E0|nr:hypothetical protein [uncultured Allobacillus sp.]